MMPAASLTPLPVGDLPVTPPDRFSVGSRHRVTTSTVTLTDPLADPGWDASIGCCPAATPFHATAWLRTLAEAYGHRFYALQSTAAGDPASRLVLGEVRSRLAGARLVSLPFSDFAPPLGGADSFTARYWVAAAREAAGRLRCNYVEFRGLPGAPADAPSFTEYCAHSLDLRPGDAALWQGLASPVRTAVRHAERAGVQVRLLHTLESVADYYRLHCVTRRQHGAPPQPWSFFAALARHVVVPGHGFVALGFVPDDPSPCAGALFLTGRDQAVYKFGASHERGRALRVNNLVMWRAIQHVAAARCSGLHFGRTDLDQPGLRRFKLGWGAVELPLRYYRVDVTCGSYQVGHHRGRSWVARLFRRLPLAVNRAAGRLLYAHMH